MSYRIPDGLIAERNVGLDAALNEDFGALDT